MILPQRGHSGVGLWALSHFKRSLPGSPRPGALVRLAVRSRPWLAVADSLVVAGNPAEKPLKTAKKRPLTGRTALW
jgi:hypothetical protein